MVLIGKNVNFSVCCGTFSFHMFVIFCSFGALVLAVLYSLSDDVAANIRRTKLLLLKSRERRRFIQLQLQHHGNNSVQRRQSLEDLALVTASRHSSLSAAVALQMLLSPSKQWHSRSSVHRYVLILLLCVFTS